MSNVAVIIQILFITIGMIIFGLVLNYVLGLRKEALNDLRNKALNLQERMRNAQLLGDYQLMAKLQQESVLFMKQMMKKQIIPLCIRCAIFLGIFAILTIIYSDYNSGLIPFPILFFGSGWVAIYFLFSISISLIIYLGKRLYRKITGKGPSSQSYLTELIKMISPTQQDSSEPFQISTAEQYQITDYNNTTKNHQLEDSSTRKDTWKDRLED
ncbi:MAG: hypothetical protein ACFFC3_02615 [Candidatus Odinarchaeota archaeon]